MNATEARQVVAVVQAGWPSRGLPPDTVQQWAGGLEEFDYEDALLAAAELVRYQSRPCSLADLRDAITETRRSRAPELPALDEGYVHASFADWYANHATPTLRATARAFLPEVCRAAGIEIVPSDAPPKGRQGTAAASPADDPTPYGGWPIDVVQQSRRSRFGLNLARAMKDRSEA